MHTLVSLVGHLAALNVRKTVARTSRNGIFIAVSVLLFLTAYLFGLIALTLWLSRRYDPIVAALSIAVGMLILGAIVLIVMAIVNKIEERRARERRIAIESAVAVGFSLLRSQPLLTAALAAGLFATSFGRSRIHK